MLGDDVEIRVLREDGLAFVVTGEIGRAHV